MNDYEARLGNALAALLAAIERHDAQPSMKVDLPARFSGAMNLPTFEEYIDTGHCFMANPIRNALCNGVREIGKIMARNGLSSDDAMRVVDIATRNSPNNSIYWEVICDKHFDGIKFANEEWVA
ncbi:hypothetical protein Nham_3346 [Nitrobacter hamburgensis X14]|uniref:Uncharacterized protein n=1 Tax=Nitrobacter hamburgensis (strain DSM 10229 / NCIMB 13809 / X14) TaxID=323097 RepID=Q1QI70_NITHX|nr:hypothetical protein [Nitrobacter hamburgensis]ABE64077.1 hypothetical protein Nham_3346 [Nitrobacter hamburgensis X14]